MDDERDSERLLEDTEEQELAELHRQQAEIGTDPDYVRWLMEVTERLDLELGPDREESHD